MLQPSQKRNKGQLLNSSFPRHFKEDILYTVSSDMLVQSAVSLYSCTEQKYTADNIRIHWVGSEVKIDVRLKLNLSQRAFRQSAIWKHIFYFPLGVWQGQGRRWTVNLTITEKGRGMPRGKGKHPHLRPNVPPPWSSNLVRATHPLSDHIKGQRRPVDKSILQSEEAQWKQGLRESRSI